MPNEVVWQLQAQCVYQSSTGRENRQFKRISLYVFTLYHGLVVQLRIFMVLKSKF